MFEITADDIAALNDEDLRALVGLLCESEARSHGFSASFVTWSGHQDASDGGLDVRVALPASAELNGFVPRPETGFQVRKTDMPRRKILAEMRPDGVLRSVIRELADRSGAYIIASSEGFTSDRPLQNRRAAMKEAVKDLPNPDAITLDFYDRGRIATWVRDHTGLIIWVKEKIGRPIHGWNSYGAWAYDPEGARGEYLLDDRIRIFANTGQKEGEMQAAEGVQCVRDRLRIPKAIIRLVGLSGVGKTRLVQALFDKRVGKDSLEPTLACYTNIADGPDPPPISLSSELIATRTRAILIVDNCPPDLHRRLSELCRGSESLISLITIEYDVREDDPEGTDVFSLEPSSIDLIEKLIKRRNPELSSVDARTIAEFSGGNAGIAMALASTIAKNETIAGLSDEDLFRRLFQQRNEPNESLLIAAQGLSLVYSFDGVDVSDGERAELFRLGALIGKNAQEMFQHAAKLESRRLLQKRGEWRAVLPHAIANRLATMALQNIPRSAIQRWLAETASERLLRSFCRRLGYLTNSKEAQSIAKEWLVSGGRLEDLPNLGELGVAIFNSIAPIVPAEVLLALEGVLLKATNDEAVTKCARYVHLLRSLAYDPTLFERCIALIVRIAEAGDADNDKSEARRVFASLFPIYLSGTHATIEQRLEVASLLLLSHDQKKRTIGLMALKASLQALNFGPGYNFEFGARSRDYGYWPRNRGDVKKWFALGLNLAESIACSKGPSAPDVRNLLCEQFRGLWTSAAMYDELERAFRLVPEGRFWREGWIAVRQTMYYDSKGLTPEVAARLAALEIDLRPRDLVQKVRSIVLPESVLFVGVDLIDDGNQDVMKPVGQVETMAHEFGRTVARSEDAFAELVPDLIAGQSQQLWHFGRGLAEGAEEPAAIWTRMVDQLATTPAKGVQVLYGFLNGLNATDPILANALLDNSVDDDTLAQWYPVLQTAVGINKKGLNRLMRSLEIGKAPIDFYRSLIGGGVTHQIVGRDFNALLRLIAQKPGGWEIAVEILGMRLSFGDGTRSTPAENIDIGCQLMLQLKFTDRIDHIADYRLGVLAKYCLVGDEGAATVREICRNLKSAIARGEAHAYYQGDLLQILLGLQPVAGLEALCEGDAEAFKLGIAILDGARQMQGNPFDAVPETDLLAWCDKDSEVRYPAVAEGITALRQSGDARRPQWTDTARKFLDKAPDRVAVLKKFMMQFSPEGWAGSHAAIVESNAGLLDDLLGYPDSTLVEFIKKEKIRIAKVIEVEREMETLLERRMDERFE